MDVLVFHQIKFLAYIYIRMVQKSQRYRRVYIEKSRSYSCPHPPVPVAPYIGNHFISFLCILVFLYSNVSTHMNKYSYLPLISYFKSSMLYMFYTYLTFSHITIFWRSFCIKTRNFLILCLQVHSILWTVL